MPRKKKEEIWKHFFTTQYNKSAKCKYCEVIYKVANVNKMENHLQKCSKFPAVVKNQLRISKCTTSAQVVVQLEENICEEDSMEVEVTNSQSQPIETALLSSDQIKQSNEFSKEKKKYLDQLISKAIFFTGAPVSMVEHPLWIKLFEELQPLYKLPSRKAIATTHLEAIYKKMESEITENIRSAANLHLQCDGWKNQGVESICNVIIAKPEPIFIKSLSTLSNQHTSQYLSQEILSVIDNYGAYKFATIIGDNENNIQEAFDLVCEVHPHIIPLRCVAQTLNLLCEDCLKIDAIKAFVNVFVETIKTVKRSKVLKALLAQIIQENGSGEFLKLPIKTVWGSYYNALKSVQRTKVALQTLAVYEEAKMASDIKAHILDENFWSMIDSCIDLLEPISEKIFQLEGSTINIHEIYVFLKEIQSALNFVIPDLLILNENDKEQILSGVNTRIDNCLRSIHFAAYMLDPRSQGLELDEAQEVESLQFLDDMSRLLNIDIMADLANYRAREGFWGKSFVWRNVTEMDPVVWWKGICGSRPLSKIAIRLLTAPCTSAATERSLRVLVHNAKRNRLTTERAPKMSSDNWNHLKKYAHETEDVENIVKSPSINNSMISPVNEPCTSQSQGTIKNFEFFDVNKIYNEEDSDSD